MQSKTHMLRYLKSTWCRQAHGAASNKGQRDAPGVAGACSTNSHDDEWTPCVFMQLRDLHGAHSSMFNSYFRKCIYSFSICVYTVTLPKNVQATFQLELLGVKKNPQGAVTTQLGVITVRMQQKKTDFLSAQTSWVKSSTRVENFIDAFILTWPKIPLFSCAIMNARNHHISLRTGCLRNPCVLKTPHGEHCCPLHADYISTRSETLNFC